MKRAFALALALLTLAAFLPALAEAPGLSGESALPENTSVSVDLDGDGTLERVSWSRVATDYDACVTLFVESSVGQRSFDTSIVSSEQVYLLDLDGDGAMELLASGDVMSDDYVTFALRYQDGELIQLLFPNDGRGDTMDGYLPYGYGEITYIGDGILHLSGSQDMLGTWWATRMVRLTPAWRFEYADNGLWERMLDDWQDPELWEYGALTATRPISYTGTHSYPDGVLQPGDRILITATDKDSNAWFITEDGTPGVLSVSHDWDRGWGYQVNGVPEDECFSYIPYAD